MAPVLRFCPATVLWVYTRANESVVLEARETPTSLQLVVRGPGHQRSTYEPADIVALIELQTRLEANLVALGFSLIAFNRDRRTQADRRMWERRNKPERRFP